MQIKENTCCFIGHRKINETEELKQKLTEVIENLIVNENVDAVEKGKIVVNVLDII